MTQNKRSGSEQMAEWCASCSYVESITYLGAVGEDVAGSLYAVIGTIGSGKSAVMAILAEMFPVIYTDEVARYVVDGLTDQISAYIGNEVLAEDGRTIDRKVLGDIVFSDPEKRRWLNALIHPAVREYVLCWAKEQYMKGAKLCFVEVTAVDGNLATWVDGIVIVKSDKEIIESRVQKRSGWPLEKIRSVIAIQEEQMKAYETGAYTLYNNQGMAELREAVWKLVRTMIAMGL